MITPELFVIDTNAIICYFQETFCTNDPISKKVKAIFDLAILDSHSNIRLSIPSVVFIEIFKKWSINEEAAYKIKNLYKFIKQCPNIEIRPLDREIVENFVKIDGIVKEHDKIIVACAMALRSPIITSDTEITAYVKSQTLIPNVINSIS